MNMQDNHELNTDSGMHPEPETNPDGAEINETGYSTIQPEIIDLEPVMDETSADAEYETVTADEPDDSDRSDRKTRRNGTKKEGRGGNPVGPALEKLRQSAEKFQNLDFPERVNLPKWFGPVARMNLPNQLTVLRMALIPLFLIVLYWGFPGSTAVGLIIFLLASLTDLLDGKIARKYQLETDFGKFADPLADKMLVTAAMVWFVECGKMSGWVLAVILCREFAVSGLRMIAAEKGRVIAAGMSGKIKTAATMVCVILMFLPLPGWLNLLCVAVIALTTVYSGVEYFLKNRDVLSES